MFFFNFLFNLFFIIKNAGKEIVDNLHFGGGFLSKALKTKEKDTDMLALNSTEGTSRHDAFQGWLDTILSLII